MVRKTTRDAPTIGLTLPELVQSRAVRIKKLLWKAAGSDAYLLSRSTYNDQVKYACLGGVVVATGFMAALAGGYAMYTIFAPGDSALVNETHMPTAIMASIFGVIWGLIIFNLELNPTMFMFKLHYCQTMFFYNNNMIQIVSNRAIL